MPLLSCQEENNSKIDFFLLHLCCFVYAGGRHPGPGPCARPAQGEAVTEASAAFVQRQPGALKGQKCCHGWKGRHRRTFISSLQVMCDLVLCVYVCVCACVCMHVCVYRHARAFCVWHMCRLQTLVHCLRGVCVRAYSDSPVSFMSFSRYPGFWHRFVSLEARASLRQNLFTIIYLPIVYTVFGLILGKSFSA